MKDAVKAICRIWRPEWQGMLMGRLTYKTGNGENKAYEEIIRDGKLLRVAVRGRKSGEFLELILSKPSAPKEGEKRPDEAAFWKSFSADEVRAYSKALGDHNEIHYTEKPVVSGFQIFESVMEEYPSDGMKISFHHPVFSGEEVYLMEKDQKIEGYTNQLCFVAVRS